MAYAYEIDPEGAAVGETMQAPLSAPLKGEAALTTVDARATDEGDSSASKLLVRSPDGALLRGGFL